MQHRQRAPSPHSCDEHKTDAVGTWAIRFYERHGFALVSPARKTVLLKSYWSIPERQIETSVVLANPPEVAARSFSPLVGRRSG